MNDASFGIDLGGTKTEGVVLRGDGSEVLRRRVPTIQGSYDATLETIASLVADLESASGAECYRLGLGIPGSISPKTGLVRNANSTWINGRPLVEDLVRRLNRPVRIANDANCLALSESHDGAAAGAASVFAVILGTGVGGGLVIDRKLVAGHHGIGGEWGHVPQPGEVDGPHCHCGRRGCVETYLSGPALLAQYLAAGGGAADGASDIATRAATGEAIAEKVLARYLERLARALAMIVNIVDPVVLVLGGGVSNLPGLADDLPLAIQPHVFADARDAIRVKVQLARWGDSSGVRGAARLWKGEQT